MDVLCRKLPFFEMCTFPCTAQTKLNRALNFLQATRFQNGGSRRRLESAVVHTRVLAFNSLSRVTRVENKHPRRLLRDRLCSSYFVVSWIILVDL